MQAQIQELFQDFNNTPNQNFDKQSGCWSVGGRGRWDTLIVHLWILKEKIIIIFPNNLFPLRCIIKQKYRLLISYKHFFYQFDFTKSLKSISVLQVSHVNTATGILLQFSISILNIQYQKCIMSCITSNKHRTKAKHSWKNRFHCRLRFHTSKLEPCLVYKSWNLSVLLFCKH